MTVPITLVIIVLTTFCLASFALAIYSIDKANKALQTLYDVSKDLEAVEEALEEIAEDFDSYNIDNEFRTKDDKIGINVNLN